MLAPTYSFGRRILERVRIANKKTNALREIANRLQLEGLEDRCVPAVVADEQLFVYLLNRARFNPVQYQLENNLPVSLAGVAARPPLAVNNQLFNSSGGHAEEMANFNYFGHQSSVTGKFPNQMVREAGYPLPTIFPNAANYVESIAAGYDDARTTLNALIVDAGIPDLGHRVHLLATIDFFADHREIGVGVGSNANSTYKKYWSAQTAYQNASDRFLTGVIYNDANKNQRYDAGEGQPGVSVAVGATVVTTNEAGGWSVKVAQGTYTVRAFGAGYQGLGLATATVGAGNVEVDFISGDPVGFVNFAHANLPSNFRINLGDDLIGRIGGQWWSAESGSSGFTNRYQGFWTTSVNWVDVQAADFSGDGRTDVLGRDAANGQWWIGIGTASGFQMQLWTVWSSGVIWSSVFAGDVNGDGRMDIIGRELTSGGWYVGISTGSSFNTVAYGTFGASTLWQDMQVGDFNGDGLTDVAGRSASTGDWVVGQSTGSSFVNRTFGKWSTGIQWQDTQVGDFNGDGRADIIGRIATTGEYWAAISTGTSFSNQRYAVWSPFAGWVDVKVADVNSDGKSDIVGRVPTSGEWYVGVSNPSGTAFTTSLFAVWSSAFSWQDVRVIDVNSDGKADIVGRAPTGDWYVGISTGSRFDTRYNGSWSPATWSDVRVGSFSPATTTNKPASGAARFSSAKSSNGTTNIAFTAIDAYMALWGQDDGFDRQDGSRL